MKAILKQDPNYAPRVDGIVTMSRAAEYFGDYMLEEVKRMNEGKNRIDYRMLYDCISTNYLMQITSGLFPSWSASLRSITDRILS